MNVAQKIRYFVRHVGITTTFFRGIRRILHNLLLRNRPVLKRGAAVTLLSGGRLYVLKGTSGMLTCLDSKTGAVHYASERLDRAENIYSSPVGAAGRVYVSGREGDTVVLEDGQEFKVIATNSIGEGIDATPAIVGDEIYLRGSKHLFCIAETE